MKFQAPISKLQRNTKSQTSKVLLRWLSLGDWNLKLLWMLVLGVWCFASRASAQEWLDQVDDSLFLQTRDGSARTDLSGTFDLEGYFIDRRAPGLVFQDTDFVNPRLSLFLDARWTKHLYAFVQARADRGFDPRVKVRDARLDEYLLRYTPFDEPSVNLQAGKFATCFGNWVARHDSWNNPFITAPMPYEHVTTVADLNVPPTPAAFLGRRDIPDNKSGWLPLLWGPSYASGASVFGTLDQFDYAAEIKNASISSRPNAWGSGDWRWDYPTLSGRVGYRPGAAWNLGASFSRGTYLQLDARNSPGFPVGRSLGDFVQTTFGGTLSYSWRHWQLWAEVFFSRFEVPNVGDADTAAYYIEAKYKITTKLFAAVRWNQQFFDDVPDGAGGEAPWDRNAWRVDAALGYRFTRHLQAKLQYSYCHQSSDLQQGEHFGAVQLTLKF